MVDWDNRSTLQNRKSYKITSQWPSCVALLGWESKRLFRGLHFMRSRWKKWDFSETYPSNCAYLKHRTVKMDFISTVDNNYSLGRKNGECGAGVNPLPYRFEKDKECWSKEHPGFRTVCLCLQWQERWVGAFCCVLIFSCMRLSWVNQRLNNSVPVLGTEIMRLPWLCRASQILCMSESRKGWTNGGQQWP